MNRVKRMIAYVTAAIIAVTCSGVISLVSASAAAKITGVKIVSYPKKTEFVQGADWDYGYYDMPEGGGLGTFVSDSRMISFKHYGGYYTRYADRGMIDKSLATEIERMLDTLDEREKTIVEMCFCINNREMTLEEISEKFGLSRERVRQIREKALLKLRHSNKKNLLQEYLG